MKNKELALIFQKIGDALEFQGENPFKIIAYRKAARILNDLTEDIEMIHKQGTLRDISGIGDQTITLGFDIYDRAGNFAWSPQGTIQITKDPPTGDLNDDQIVDIFDLVIVGSSFGKSPGEPGYDPRADANRSGGAINIADLVMVGGRFGSTG